MSFFVFGSNLAGRHGKGAAKTALKWGAQHGVGAGPSGQTYAIPTKDFDLQPLSLQTINTYVAAFLLYAITYKTDTFLVTKIGCGLSGYKPEQIKPMFYYTSSNVILPIEFSHTK